MTHERTSVILGLAATVIGSIQVVTTLALIPSSTHALTLMDTLRMSFCGSLATVGVLTLVDVNQHRRRSKR